MSWDKCYALLPATSQLKNARKSAVEDTIYIVSKLRYGNHSYSTNLAFKHSTSSMNMRPIRHVHPQYFSGYILTSINAT